MIQRKQSLFLLVATVLTGMTFTMPIVKLATAIEGSTNMNNYVLNATGYTDQANLSTALPALPLAIITGMVTAIALLSIFLFKNRGLQMRLVRLNMLLLVGLIGMVYFYGSFVGKQLGVGELAYQIGAIYPIISIVLHFMALQGIKKDDSLVKSLDRLR